MASMPNDKPHPGEGARCGATRDPDNPDEVRCWAEVPASDSVLAGDVDALVEYIKGEITRAIIDEEKRYLAEQERLMLYGDGSVEPVGIIAKAEAQP